MLLWVAVILAAAAIGLWLLGWRQRRQAGLPPGRVIYSDTRTWGALEKPLYDPLLNLTGKPDYLVEEGEHLIPVEVKSARPPGAPYDAHILQLAAYCLLVETAFGRRPPYGILHYPNRTYAIDYTPDLENTLLALLDELRLHEKRRVVHRSHQQAGRCARCGFRSLCDERLGS